MQHSTLFLWKKVITITRNAFSLYRGYHDLLKTNLIFREINS